MKIFIFIKLLTIFIVISTVSAQLATLARWCVTTDAEEKKCEDWVKNLESVKRLGDTAENVIPAYKKNNVVDFKSMPVLSCVRAVDVFECMARIEKNEVDLITLEAGQGYFAGRYHSMRPIMAEKYSSNSDPTDLSYFAVMVKRAGSPLRIDTLRDRNACVPGIGTGAGWVYPISYMLQRRLIQVTECNAVVKTVTNFFRQMCLPGALHSFYNQFGNNPTSVCELCVGKEDQRCTSSDPYAGFDGAYRCLNGGGDVAFLRHDTIEMSTGLSADPSQYQLVCPDSTIRAIGEHEQCNFGKVPNDIVMTSSMKEDATVAKYKNFLTQNSAWFKMNGPYYRNFTLFSSRNGTGTWYDKEINKQNLLFNDATSELVDVKEKDRYYTWIGDEFRSKLVNLNSCPVDVVRLCVISENEREKCERMVEVFRGKDIKPDMDCIMTSSTHDCMRLLSTGDADLTMLDAGDIYKAGKQYNLVPIAAEDYGDMTAKFKVVAAARKRDLYMTLFNLKHYRACHAGIGRGDGWVVPLNIYIETQQFIPAQCTIFDNLGQLFSRSCIPGALDKEYNPSQMPINLCEGCQGGGYRKCARNSDELYYGTTGAFRCLVENAGDVAFVHHLTVGDNTDGRNQAIWARNRRSDDYELLCKDGTRTSIENWATCHLGEVPGAALVTSGYVNQQRRDLYWNIFSYGQQFFSSDIDGDFHMFDSGLFYSDLIFNDEAVRLIPVAPENQNYQRYLGWDFINQVENLDEYQCVPISAAPSSVPAIGFVSLVIAAIVALL